MRNLLSYFAVLCPLTCSSGLPAADSHLQCERWRYNPTAMIRFSRDQLSVRNSSVSFSQTWFLGPRKVSFSGLPYRQTCQFGRAASIRTCSASRKPFTLSKRHSALVFSKTNGHSF